MQIVPKRYDHVENMFSGITIKLSPKEFPAKVLALRSKWSAEADVSKSLKPGGTERVLANAARAVRAAHEADVAAALLVAAVISSLLCLRMQVI